MKEEEEEEECNERTFSVRNLVATNRARVIRHVDCNKRVFLPPSVPRGEKHAARSTICLTSSDGSSLKNLYVYAIVVIWITSDIARGNAREREATPAVLLPANQ